MRFFEHEHYLEDVAQVAEQLLPWEKMQGKSVFISGGTGLIGSFLIDVLMRTAGEARQVWVLSS